jgi:hypothetical protein
MYFVPEGEHDSSHSTRYRLLMAGLARSAWESVHRENRPVGYGMIGRSYPRHHRGISRRRCAPCFLRKAIYFVLEISSLRIEIGAHACANQTYPTGRLFWVAPSQALRARPGMSKR